MSHDARLPWGVLAASLTTMAAGVVLLSLVPAAATGEDGDTLVLTVLFVFVLSVFGVVGAVVASRTPNNPIGWLFLTLAFVNGCYELTYGWTHYSLGVHELVGTRWTGWAASWLSTVSPAFLGLAVLLFPDGRSLSPRWRPAAWLCVLVTASVVAQDALVPGPTEEFPGLDNPIGAPGAAVLRDVPIDGAFVLVFVVAAASVAVRFKRSRGVQRQQLKWFVWSVGLMAAFLVVGGLASSVGSTDARADYVAGFVFAAVLAGLPLSAGVAILRYRLYDIDLVINRTLVYGALSAALVATYLSSVLLLRVALGPLTGDSDLAVAASTLAAAVVFRPLRSRIQSVVDRRFYRARYDAGRTMAHFSARLRDELDLDSLGVDLRAAVRDTMAPTHVSLWLREAP